MEIENGFTTIEKVDRVLYVRLKGDTNRGILIVALRGENATQVDTFFPQRVSLIRMLIKLEYRFTLFKLTAEAVLNEDRVGRKKNEHSIVNWLFIFFFSVRIYVFASKKQGHFCY